MGRFDFKSIYVSEFELEIMTNTLLHIPQLIVDGKRTRYCLPFCYVRIARELLLIRRNE